MRTTRSWPRPCGRQARPRRPGGQLKWALLGLVGGAALMLVFFTRMTLVALAGFVLMVLAVAWIAVIARRRAGVASERAWKDRLRRHPGSGRQG